MAGASFYEKKTKNTLSMTEKGTDAYDLIEYPRRKKNVAFRAPKIKELNGHEFIGPKYFAQPTYCAFCKEFLW